MDRFGIRPVVTVALLMIALGSGLTVFMTAAWQLVLCWGVLVGVGAGSMSMAFVATVVNRWFVARRGLVSGILTAGNATRTAGVPAAGRLDHHPPRLAHGRPDHGRGGARRGPAGPLLMRNHPADMGLDGVRRDARGPRSATAPGERVLGRSRRPGAGQRHPHAGVLAAGGRLRDLRCHHERADRHALHPGGDGPRHATHHRGQPARPGRPVRRGRHGSPRLVHRRLDPRYLLLTYYTLRGVGLAVLPALLAPHTTPGTWVFVIFYGLDWVATVPPTVMLCREWFGPEEGSIVFGWVFASHTIGASAMAFRCGCRSADQHRLLQPGVLPRLGALCDRRAALPEHPASGRRLAGATSETTPVAPPGDEVSVMS
jgi:hypothetical protein